MGKFDSLKNGQYEAEIQDFESRLRQDPVGVLSAFALQLEKLTPKDLLLSEVEEVQKKMYTLCLEIKALFQKTEAAFVRPRGIFVTEAERHAAYLAVCHLLGKLEGTRRALRTLSLSASAYRKTCARALLRMTILQNELTAAHMAAWHLGLDEKIAVSVKKASLLQERWQALADLCKEAAEASRRIEGITVQFCKQISSLADLENEGTHAEPVEILRLVGEASYRLGTLSI